jgi:hypothetical protein
MLIRKKQIIIGLVLLLIIGLFLFLKNKESNVPLEKGIELYNIIEGQNISSPLLIKGVVSGGKWAGFGGQMGRVELVESNGIVLGSAPLVAISDWMKFPVNFEANLKFDNSKDSNVSLVFYNENPSGIAENSASKSFLVKISPEKIKVKLYFGKLGNDSCDNFFPIEREIVKTEGIAKATIEELLKGLTIEEKQLGYFTSINEGAKINNLTIVDETAKIDFNEALEKGVGGSCQVLAIRQQIIQTLMQFSSVKKVIISIDGRTEDILQP